MKNFCLGFHWTQYHRGTAIIQACSLGEAKAIAELMHSDDGRIEFEPYDGELKVLDVEQARE